MNHNPNPQGKGLVSVFASLAESRARIAVPPKHIEQVSNELFTSLFVLHSQFQFKPVVGKPYWLYRSDNRFRLSLISPDEWGNDSYGQFIGKCVMQKDITWALELDEQAANDAELMQLIENRRRHFEKIMAEADTVDNILPFYLDGLPFYQRVYASALACSLRDSMTRSGIAGLAYAEARRLLPDQSI